MARIKAEVREVTSGRIGKDHSLERLDRPVRDNIEKAGDASAKRILSATKARCPVGGPYPPGAKYKSGKKKRPGTLRDSYTINAIPELLKWFVGTNDRKAHLIEWGSVHNKATPHLFNSAEEEEPVFEAAVEQAIGSAIDEVF
jgi:hypothetical protein